MQVESFIPFWEWDLPKKKKGKKNAKEGGKEKSAKGAADGATAEKTVPVPRQSQQASIEEVADDDDA